MNSERINLSERLLEFGVAIIKISRKLHNTYPEYHIRRQIVRSATSAGANYEEACSGESRADFIHKLQITLKELNETLYWLRLIEKIYLPTIENLNKLIQENRELCAIVAKSVLTSKQRSNIKP